MSGSSSSTSNNAAFPPQLQLSIPPTATSFKRSFEQFGFDLDDSPLGGGQHRYGRDSSDSSNAGRPSGSGSQRNDRNKRARSASSLSNSSNNSDRTSALSSSSSSRNRATASSSNTSLSAGSEQSNAFASSSSTLQSMSGGPISGPLNLALGPQFLARSSPPPRLSTPEIIDVDIETEILPSSSLDAPISSQSPESPPAPRTSTSSLPLPLSLSLPSPVLTPLHSELNLADSPGDVSLSTAHAGPSTSTSRRNHDAVRQSIQRFNAFEHEIAALRHGPSFTRASPPTLPPLVLDYESPSQTPASGHRRTSSSGSSAFSISSTASSSSRPPAYLDVPAALFDPAFQGLEVDAGNSTSSSRDSLERDLESIQGQQQQRPAGYTSPTAPPTLPPINTATVIWDAGDDSSNNSSPIEQESPAGVPTQEAPMALDLDAIRNHVPPSPSLTDLRMWLYNGTDGESARARGSGSGGNGHLSGSDIIGDGDGSRGVMNNDGPPMGNARAMTGRMFEGSSSSGSGTGASASITPRLDLSFGATAPSAAARRPSDAMHLMSRLTPIGGVTRTAESTGSEGWLGGALVDDRSPAIASFLDRERELRNTVHQGPSVSAAGSRHGHSSSPRVEPSNSAPNGSTVLDPPPLSAQRPSSLDLNLNLDAPSQSHTWSSSSNPWLNLLSTDTEQSSQPTASSTWTQSEAHSRHNESLWRRFSFTDQPSHGTSPAPNPGISSLAAFDEIYFRRFGVRRGSMPESVDQTAPTATPSPAVPPAETFAPSFLTNSARPPTLHRSSTLRDTPSETATSIHRHSSLRSGATLVNENTSERRRRMDEMDVRRGFRPTPVDRRTSSTRNAESFGFGGSNPYSVLLDDRSSPEPPTQPSHPSATSSRSAAPSGVRNRLGSSIPILDMDSDIMDVTVESDSSSDWFGLPSTGVDSRLRLREFLERERAARRARNRTSTSGTSMDVDSDESPPRPDASNRAMYSSSLRQEIDEGMRVLDEAFRASRARALARAPRPVIPIRPIPSPNLRLEFNDHSAGGPSEEPPSASFPSGSRQRQDQQTRYSQFYEQPSLGPRHSQSSRPPSPGDSMSVDYFPDALRQAYRHFDGHDSHNPFIRRPSAFGSSSTAPSTSFGNGSASTTGINTTPLNLSYRRRSTNPSSTTNPTSSTSNAATGQAEATPPSGNLSDMFMPGPFQNTLRLWESERRRRESPQESAPVTPHLDIPDQPSHYSHQDRPTLRTRPLSSMLDDDDSAFSASRTRRWSAFRPRSELAAAEPSNSTTVPTSLHPIPPPNRGPMTVPRPQMYPRLPPPPPAPHAQYTSNLSSAAGHSSTLERRTDSLERAAAQRREHVRQFRTALRRGPLDPLEDIDREIDRHRGTPTTSTAAIDAAMARFDSDDDLPPTRAPRRVSYRRPTGDIRRRSMGGFTFGDFLPDDGFDDSYEALLSLTERLGDVRPRRTPADVMESLEKAKYSQWADSDSDKRCPICLDDYGADDPVMKLKNCPHWMHHDCLGQWLQTSTTCPVCRKTVLQSPRMGSRPAASTRTNSTRWATSSTPTPSNPSVPPASSAPRTTAFTASRRTSSSPPPPVIPPGGAPTPNTATARDIISNYHRQREIEAVFLQNHELAAQSTQLVNDSRAFIARVRAEQDEHDRLSLMLQTSRSFERYLASRRPPQPPPGSGSSGAGGSGMAS